MATAATISVELNLDTKSFNARVTRVTGGSTAFSIEAFDKKTLNALLEQRKQLVESMRNGLAGLGTPAGTAKPKDAPKVPEAQAGESQEVTKAREVNAALEQLQAKRTETAGQAAKARLALEGGATETDLKAKLTAINAPLSKLPEGTAEYAVGSAVAKATIDDTADLRASELQAKAKDINLGLQEDQRAVKQEKTDTEIGNLNRELALYIQYGADRKAIEDDFQAYRQALQDKTDRDNEFAFQKTLRDWRDVTTQLGNAASGWLTSASNELTTFVMTGKANFTNLAQSIIKDLIRISIQTAIGNAAGGSGIFGLLTKGISLLGGALGFGDGTAPIKDAGIGTSTEVRVVHTGGIIGRDGLEMRSVLSSVFDGAKRFHTGGMPGLSSGEVPAILKRGEGVFTEGQMAALGAGLGGGGGGGGGGGAPGVTVANTFNIQAGAGSGDTAKDQALAQQIGAQVTNQVRGLVVDELYRQGQPGGLLYGR